MADAMSPERAEEIRGGVRERYRTVAKSARGHFKYPVGRESVEKLGYAREWLDAIPHEVVDRFVGVGNPFTLRTPGPGERVLDVGCGCGFDTFAASLLVGPSGRAVGVDLTPEMVEAARLAQASSAFSSRANLEFREGAVETLPFEDGSFDLVISNGVLNLVPDKDAAFREIARVLRPGGRLAAADLLVTENVPEEQLADIDAWSS